MPMGSYQTPQQQQAQGLEAVARRTQPLRPRKYELNPNAVLICLFVIA